jgi:hypothetical protein
MDEASLRIRRLGVRVPSGALHTRRPRLATTAKSRAFLHALASRSGALWEPRWEPPGPSGAPNSARLIASAAERRPPSSRCPYTSLMIVMDVWPSISETTCNSVPWASISDAPECRSSWGCQCPSAARWHRSENRCEKLSGSSGVLTSLGKISPWSCHASPAARRSSACWAPANGQECGHRHQFGDDGVDPAERVWGASPGVAHGPVLHVGERRPAGRHRHDGEDDGQHQRFRAGRRGRSGRGCSCGTIHGVAVDDPQPAGAAGHVADRLGVAETRTAPASGGVALQRHWPTAGWVCRMRSHRAPRSRIPSPSTGSTSPGSDSRSPIRVGFDGRSRLRRRSGRACRTWRCSADVRALVPDEGECVNRGGGRRRQGGLASAQALADRQIGQDRGCHDQCRAQRQG